MSFNVVIADDHPVVRIGARTIIEASRIGKVVAEADSPEALMNILATTPCDVLVTDYSMPGGSLPDGQAMVSAIGRRYPQLPVILLSMTTNMSILRLALSAGVLGLVDKASSLDELPAAIQSVVRKESYISTGLREKVADLDGTETGVARKLSPRETEVLRLLASGMSVTEIGAQLHRSVTTISRQKSSAMRKLGIVNDAELFSYLQGQWPAGG